MIFFEKASRSPGLREVIIPSSVTTSESSHLALVAAVELELIFPVHKGLARRPMKKRRSQCDFDAHGYLATSPFLGAGLAVTLTQAPRDRPKEDGATVEVVSPEPGEIRGWDTASSTTRLKRQM